MRLILLTGLLILINARSLPAQLFGQQRLIVNAPDAPHALATADLDGDLDQDLLWGSHGRVSGTDRAVWHENLGLGSFGPAVTLINGAQGCRSVAASDLDQDGDQDVLAVSEWNDTLYWVENLGNGQFGSPIVLSTSVDNADSVTVSDFDQDGLPDVFTASSMDDTIALFPNLGGGVFGSRQVLATTGGAICIVHGDLDQDGDEDLIFCGYRSASVYWLENLNGSFGQAQSISVGVNPSATDLACSDLNGDGLLDVLCASQGDNAVSWFENLGGGGFSTERNIDTQVTGAFSVFAADLDLDGDQDVIACGRGTNVFWYENDGLGSFPSPEVVATGQGPRHAIATDLDGDGDLDVLSAFHDDRSVFWTENLHAPDSDADGINDLTENALGTDPFDQDTDDDGLGDGEEANTSRPDTRWLQGPSGNYYRLAPASSWSQASSAARAQGYELTSIQDQAEAEWLADTYGAVSGGFWIGLSDFLGTYTWSDGDPSTYRRWAAGEPNAANSPAGVFVGGPSAAEPGYWYTNAFGAGSYLAVWEAPGPDAPMTATDPLNWDTDGDGLGDGQEDGLDQVVWDGDLDGDGIPDVGGTDLAFFVPDADPGTTTDPLNLDSDNDGLADGAEDLDGDGARGASETDPSNFDTDGDQLPDGLELGLTAGTLDTDGNVFIADADPLTTTNPTLRDTDTGGVEDGIEDQNRDGGVDTWETDPNLGADESLAFYVSDLSPGQTVHFEVYNATPFQVLAPAYSIAGPGPTALGIGVTVDLSQPINTLTPVLADIDGRASWNGPRVPGGISLGLPVWLQLVEIPFTGSVERVSNPILLPVGAN